jgi:cytosine/creatinine deaminase
VAIESYHFDFMLEAIREAEASIAQGGLPIGAVLTRDNKVIARGHNNRVQEKNVILHGEMSCLRQAGVISFHDTVMYTTLSPCSMCARARSVQGPTGGHRGIRHLPGLQGHPRQVRHPLD